MKKFRVLLFGIIAIGLTAACSQSEKTQTIAQQIDGMITEAKFDDAHSLLDAQPESEEKAALREKVHLQHGIYLIYNADPSEMRENANNALWQFIAVLEINPENEKARAEIDQILGIYRTFPNRQPAEDVMEKLKEMGFQI